MARHWLVDVCNVFHAWDASRPRGKELDAQVRELTESVRGWVDFEGESVSLVVDGRGRETEVQVKDEGGRLTVIWSPAELDADTVLERLLQRLPNPEEAVVVSNDNRIRHTAFGCKADVISPEEFEREIERLHRRLSQRLKEETEEVDKQWRTGLFDSLF